MLQLTRARNRLTTPATLTLPEIAASGLTVSTSGSLCPKRDVPSEKHSQWEFCAWGQFSGFSSWPPIMLTQFPASGFHPSSTWRLWRQVGSL